jgi:hypothetical protein
MKEDWTPEERAAIEAKYKADLRAADPKRYAEVGDVVPFEEVIRELEEKQRLRNGPKK